WAAAAGRAGIAYYPKLLVGVPLTPVAGARFLAVGAARREIIHALAAALEERCRRDCFSSVHVNFCLPDETAVLGDRGWLQRTGYQYHWSNPGFATFDEYLAGLRSKRRNQTRRERRALAADGVEITVHAGSDIPPALMPRMFELYQSTVGWRTRCGRSSAASARRSPRRCAGSRSRRRCGAIGRSPGTRRGAKRWGRQASGTSSWHGPRALVTAGAGTRVSLRGTRACD